MSNGARAQLMAAGSELAAGDPAVLGSRWDGEGVLFSVYSATAEQLELCLFDAAGLQTQVLPFGACDDGVWHGYLPGLAPGASYGFRAHGEFAPEQGHYFNPNRLLLDPYARAHTGEYRVDPVNCVAQFKTDDQADQSASRIVRSAAFERDNAAFVPRSVVVSDESELLQPLTPAPAQRVIYEAHVRGLTALNTSVAELSRGCYAGAGSDTIIAHLRSLGVTSLQLLPIQSFVDEPHLVDSGLRNYWGYNTLNFFAPHAAYARAGACARQEVRQLVRDLHDANIEVLLDVVYNHTAEGGADGPSLCYRGLDNSSYYKLDTAAGFAYANDTGCGNTLNTNSPIVQRLVLDSLRYWVEEFAIDGFRFDLAVTLGREATGFNAHHALFEQMRSDPVLANRTLIAEPWDVGPGGYQTGAFARPWLEWNDRFRDAARSYWRNDAGAQAELGRRLHGSSDLFEHNARDSHTSVNLITAHDGFTLEDLVSYVEKHNEANGEMNRDGHNHNLSDNLGVEGASDNDAIFAARDRRARALLATLLLAQGTPMLLAGDELKNSQGGNNNAYCQDNPVGWLDWSSPNGDHINFLRRLTDLRDRLQLFRQRTFVHAPWVRSAAADARWGDEPQLRWMRFDGADMCEDDWSAGDATEAAPFVLLWAQAEELVVIALNPTAADMQLTLPEGLCWQACLDTSQASGTAGRATVEALTAGCSPVVATQSLNLFLATNSGAQSMECSA